MDPEFKKRMSETIIASAERNDKYYAQCKKCSKVENKLFLSEHDGLCGECSGVLKYKECPTCGHEGYFSED